MLVLAGEKQSDSNLTAAVRQHDLKTTERLSFGSWVLDWSISVPEQIEVQHCELNQAGCAGWC